MRSILPIQERSMSRFLVTIEYLANVMIYSKSLSRAENISLPYGDETYSCTFRRLSGIQNSLVHLPLRISHIASTLFSAYKMTALSLSHRTIPDALLNEGHLDSEDLNILLPKPCSRPNFLSGVSAFKKSHQPTSDQNRTTQHFSRLGYGPWRSEAFCDSFTTILLILTNAMASPETLSIIAFVRCPPVPLSALLVLGRYH